jgi:hypothetical protein
MRSALQPSSSQQLWVPATYRRCPNRKLREVTMIQTRTMRYAGIAAAALGALLLSACGGNGAGGSTSPASTTTSTTGTAGTTATTGTSTSGTTTVAMPTISGDGSATLTAGSAYNFTPTASATASSLTFSVSNKPAWATFNVVTGQLSGTPGTSNIGTYSNITISATNGSTAATLAAFSITVAAALTSSGAATLSWTPPTQNTDGTSLANLAGYFIYYGNSASALSNKIQITNPGLTAFTVTGLSSGTTYFAISAYAVSGAESALSNIGSKTI